MTHKTTEATGYPALRVRCIMGEKTSFCGAAFTSPAKWYKVDRKTVRSNDFDLEAMRSLVRDLYCEKKYPTLDSLLFAAKEKGLNSGECVTLWIILRKMGFKFKDVNNKRYIYEQPSIIFQTPTCLRRLRANRREGRPLVYLDETWENARDGREKMWVD